MRKVTVPLGARTYPVLVGEGLLTTLGRRCRALGSSTRCAVLADETVAARYGDLALKSLRDAGFAPVLIPFAAGEKSKSLRVVERCYAELARHRLERRSLIVALGGGVTGDLAGFVAATYLRGLPFVQVPTTLLAQVDSSVGGKVGVNLAAGKNLVGAFLQPKLVLCDLSTLQTLPEREFRAGLAEVIKYGIIHDPALFRRLERDWDRVAARDPRVLESVVARCCRIKAHVVSEDETESGLRAILNFGHTIGHGIEAITRYGEYLHGEAISIGQVAAAMLSERRLGLAPSVSERIRQLFLRAGLPVSIRLSAGQRVRLLAAMRLDKKVSGGEVKFVLASALGKVTWGHAIPESEVHAVLDALAGGTRRSP
ncbi:MAG: 3-dehydroquinate synthase [Verrucomicrobiales bacterium]|nr:3-dehydroquinate synthase [Verrucomicrobiales bacterium]